MTLLQHYQFSLLLTTLLTITVGLWVYLQGKNNKVAQWFCLYSLGVGWWAWCQAQAGLTPDPVVSVRWGRAMFYVVLTFPVLLIHFFAAFLEIERRKACLLGWLLVISFAPFIASDLVLRPSGPLAFLPAFPRAGPFFLPFNLIWFGWVGYGWRLLARRRRDGGGPTRQQIRFLLWIFISGYTTTCTNYLYFYGICLSPLQPLATYGGPIAFLFVAYGVFAYNLFDIHVVIRKSLIYSIVVTLLTVGYFVLVYGIERIFQTALGYHSIRISLAAFALMALAFQPLKIGVQRLVDQLLFHASHEELVKRMERLEHEVQQTERLKTVATLASGLAHEIKNPLAAVKTFTDYLPERHQDRVFIEKFHRIVSQEVEKIQTIVGNLLTFAKPQPTRPAPVCLGELVQETLALLNGACLKRQVDLEVQVDPSACVVGDRTHLKQALLNLCLNSLDAMAQGGRLCVDATQEDGHVTLSVRDTGTGIDRRDLDHVFEPFFTTKQHGTGLGLSVVHGIVTEHGGRVTIDSDVGRGTTVRIQLPVNGGGKGDAPSKNLDRG